jgi:hypothetical protein
MSGITKGGGVFNVMSGITKGGVFNVMSGITKGGVFFCCRSMISFSTASFAPGMFYLGP